MALSYIWLKYLKDDGEHHLYSQPGSLGLPLDHSTRHLSLLYGSEAVLAMVVLLDVGLYDRLLGDSLRVRVVGLVREGKCGCHLSVVEKWSSRGSSQFSP